jgi:hypothetical protein
MLSGLCLSTKLKNLLTLTSDGATMQGISFDKWDQTRSRDSTIWQIAVWDTLRESRNTDHKLRVVDARLLYFCNSLRRSKDILVLKVDP